MLYSQIYLIYPLIHLYSYISIIFYNIKFTSRRSERSEAYKLVKEHKKVLKNK